MIPGFEYHFFGFISLRHYKYATVIAKTGVVIYQINREIVKSFVSQYHEFAIKLRKSIIERHSANEVNKLDATDILNKKEKVVLDFVDSFRMFLACTFTDNDCQLFIFSMNYTDNIYTFRFLFYIGNIIKILCNLFPAPINNEPPTKCRCFW